MADTLSTGNTTPTVDSATPTTIEESSEETVQLAQAAAAVQVASPGRGAEASVTVEAGRTYKLVDPVVRFTQDAGDLVVHWRDGGHTTLEDYLVFAQTDLPPALTLADGTVISFDQLVASIEGFDPGVIAPAAAPAVEQAAGGAFNTPFDPGDIPGGPGITDLLLNTELQFGLIEDLEELPPDVEAVDVPPLADEPTANPENPANNPEGTVVDEALGDQDGHGTVFTPVSVNGNVLDNDDFGADGPGTPQITDVTYDGALGPAIKDTSVAGEITFTASNWTLLIITDGVDAGDYLFTQTDQFDHPLVQGTNSVDGVFTYTIQDSDGDTDSTDLTIRIVDDVPTALADTESVDPGATETGNVITGVGTTSGAAGEDTEGADGASVVGVAAGDTGSALDDGGTVGVAIPGSLGDLTLQSDGSYSYTADPNVSGTDTFTYTIKDGDGDLSFTTVTITVNSSTPVVNPEANTVDEAGLDLVVDGDDLAAGDTTGSDSSNTTETVTGTLNFSDPDGVTVTGVAAGDSGSDVSGNVATVIDGTFGKLLVNADGTYTYTLTTNSTDHTSQGTAIDGVTDVFTYTVTDSFGNTNTSTITISIIDDIPVQNAATVAETVKEDGLNSAVDEPPLSSSDGDDQSTGNKEGGETDTDDEASGSAGSLTALVSSGADEPVTISLSSTTSGLPTLFSKGVQVSYAVTDSDSDGILDTLTATADSRTVFTLKVNTDGSWTFDLDDQLDHVDDAMDDENTALRTNLAGTTSVASIDFSSIIVATDFDGDSITLDASSFMITVEDDVPVFTSADHGVVANTVDTAVTGDLTASVGADEPGVFSLLNNIAPVDLASGGQPVVYFIDPSNPDLLIAHIGADPNVLANQVFTLALNGDGTYTFTLLKALDAIEVVPIGAAQAFGSGPTGFQILTETAGSTSLAIISGGVSSGAINGSTAGWGIDNNQFGTGQTIRLDFGDQEAGSPGPGTFNGPLVSSAIVEFLKYSNGDQISFTAFFVNADGSAAGDSGLVTITVTGAGNIDTPVVITAPSGLFIDFIDFNVISAAGQGGKFDLVDVSVITTTGTLDLDFNVDITDEDGDTTSGVIGITVDGSTDVLDGTTGNDVIAGDDTAQTLNGLDGDDTLIGDGGADNLDGGTGSDTASYESATSGVIANLASPGSNTGDAAGDTYASIENLLGSDFADTLTGDGNANILIGGGGNDTLTGGSGADTFGYTSAGDGADTILDFDFTGESDIVDLDALFDALGVVGAEARADDVKITAGTDGVLAIDGVAGFSITFTGEDFGGNNTFGQFSAAELAALGIDVGS